jgi:Aminotransferase class I and II
MYAFDTDVCGGRAVTVPRNKDFSLDMPAVLAAIDAERPKVVFLTSPNNPDGSILPEAHLLQLLSKPVRPRPSARTLPPAASPLQHACAACMLSACTRAGSSPLALWAGQQQDVSFKAQT